MKLIIFVTLAICLVSLSCLGQARPVNFTFTWTATGDDSLLGQASKYDLKYSTTTLTNENWTSAISIPESLTKLPKPCGQAETLFVTLHLIQGYTYYFAIKAGDDGVPINWSDISNVVDRFINDIIPPAMIVNFQWE